MTVDVAIWDPDELHRMGTAKSWPEDEARKRANQVRNITGHEYTAMNMGNGWQVRKEPEVGDEVCLETPDGELLWAGVVTRRSRFVLRASRGLAFRRVGNRAQKIARGDSPEWEGVNAEGRLVLAGLGAADRLYVAA